MATEDIPKLKFETCNDAVEVELGYASSSNVIFKVEDVKIVIETILGPVLSLRAIFLEDGIATFDELNVDVDGDGEPVPIINIKKEYQDRRNKPE